MPLVRIETAPSLDATTARAVAARLSPLVAQTLRKPERYVMVIVAGAVAARMSGAEAPAAFVDVRSIGGLGEGVNELLCGAISSVLHELAGIDPQRVFANFANVEAGNWGHGDTTFG